VDLVESETNHFQSTLQRVEAITSLGVVSVQAKEALDSLYKKFARIGLVDEETGSLHCCLEGP
jgi:hypothetical protein